MKIEDIANIQMAIGTWEKVRAYATVTLTNGLAIRGIKLIEGSKGLFLGMPSRKTKKDGKDAWEDCVFFLEKDDFFAFSKAVIDKYNELKASGNNGKPVAKGTPAKSFSEDDGLGDFIG